MIFRGSLLAGCLAFLLLANCFGPYFSTFDIGVMNMSLERFFVIALVVAYLAQLATRRIALQPPLGKADWSLLALLAWIVVSAFTHDWRSPEDPVVQHIVNGYGMPLAVFWIARGAALTERRLNWTYGCLIAFGVYLALTGLCEVTGQWWAVFPRYIADPEVGLHFGRARGPMAHSVSYGLCLAVCLMCGWVWWPRLTRRYQLVLLGLLPTEPSMPPPER